MKYTYFKITELSMGLKKFLDNKNPITMEFKFHIQKLRTVAKMQIRILSIKRSRMSIPSSYQQFLLHKM